MNHASDAAIKDVAERVWICKVRDKSDAKLFVDVVRKRVPQLRGGFLRSYGASNFEAFFK
jgi:hypothetical protein